MRLHRFMCVLVLLGAAGCAQVATNTANRSAPALHVDPARMGVIVSLRPVAVSGERASWRNALLADASGTTITGGEAATPLTEFIIRTDGGSTVSVVQSNEPDFHPGDRVMILGSGNAHIARPDR